MPKIDRSSGLSWRKHTTKKELTIWLYWLIGLSIVTYAWNLVSEKTIWFFVQDAGTQALDIGSRMVPPKFTYMDENGMAKRQLMTNLSGILSSISARG